MSTPEAPEHARPDCRRSSSRCWRSKRAPAASTLLRADPIAIVGMGCRLPGGVDDPEAFWHLLRDGVDAVREVPPRSLGRRCAGTTPTLRRRARRPPSRAASSTRSTASMRRSSASCRARRERMDPQQRLFLEVAIEALDHAGLPRERLAGSRTGVFIASYHNDYAQLQYNDPQHDRCAHADRHGAQRAGQPAVVSARPARAEHLDRHRVLVLAGRHPPGVPEPALRRKRRRPGRRRVADGQPKH